MATEANVPALLALFLGLYYCAAAIGGLSHPGNWARMVEEIDGSPYLQLVGGIIAMLVGFTLIAAVDPRRGLLELVLFVWGCLAAVKGLVFLMLPGRMIGWSRPLVARPARGYAVVALAIGLGFLVAAAARAF